MPICYPIQHYGVQFEDIITPFGPEIEKVNARGLLTPNDLLTDAAAA